LDDDLSKVPAEIERWIWGSWQLSPEVIFWRMFADAEAGQALRLWFAGHYGVEWDTHPNPRSLRGEVPRRMPSGCSLTEARLRYGIIDCSIVYLFSEDCAQVFALTNSRTLDPWRLGNEYDRPLARYLLESRGVARHEFGFGKRAVAQDYDAPQGRELRAEFFAATGWSELSERATRSLNLGIYFARRAVAFAQARGKRMAMMSLGQDATKNTLKRRGAAWDLRRQTFVYCVNALADRLARRSEA
jgi:hypothetical protein